MLLEKTPEEIIELLGFDGHEIWWEDEVAPLNQRTVNPSDIQRMMCLNNLGCLAFIEGIPQLSPDGTKENAKDAGDFDTLQEQFMKILEGRPGLLEGESYRGTGHTVAWDGFKVYDSNYGIYEADSPVFVARYAWLKCAFPEPNHRDSK